MKNAKKWLAVASALCMVVPSMTAFASAVPNTQTSTGQGSIEYDSKEVPKYYHVSLPTIGSGTYDFVLDPMKVLAQYDSSYAPGATADNVTAFFKCTTMGRTLKAKTTGETLHAYEYTELTASTTTTLTAALAEFVSSGAIQAPTNVYYVWTPDTSDAGKPDGIWVPLDENNVLDYCVALDTNGKEVTTGIDHLALNPDYRKNGEEIFDGKLYALQPATAALVDGEYDVTDYVTVDNTGAITGVATGGTGFCTKDAAGTTITKIDASNVTNKVELVEAVVKNTNTSDKFVIVNKSSAATDVKAEVTIVNPEGLDFLAAAPTATDLDANVFMQIENGSGTKGNITAGTAVVVSEQTDGSVTGTVTVHLEGADDINDYLSYQGAPVAELGGGHEILRYNKPTMSYEMAELNLKVETNDVAGIADADDKKTAEDAWGEYVKGLKDGTYTKPDVDVVYTLSNAVNAPTEVAVTGNWQTDGLWFQLDGNVIDKDQITKVSVLQADGVSYADLTDMTAFTLGTDGKWLRITWRDLVDKGGSDGSNVEFKMTYNGKVYVVTPAASNP